MLGNTFSKNVIYQNHNHKNRMAIVRHWYLLLLLSAAGLCSCDGGRLSVVSSDFGTLSTGEQTTLYTLTNRSGARMTVCDYGARIVSIQVPDRDGVLGDVVVGYGDIEIGRAHV